MARAARCFAAAGTLFGRGELRYGPAATRPVRRLRLSRRRLPQFGGTGLKRIGLPSSMACSLSTRRSRSFRRSVRPKPEAARQRTPSFSAQQQLRQRAASSTSQSFLALRAHFGQTK